MCKDGVVNWGAVTSPKLEAIHALHWPINCRLGGKYHKTISVDRKLLKLAWDSYKDYVKVIEDNPDSDNVVIERVDGVGRE